MRKAKDILVIGGGVAGLAMAIGLHNTGLKVEVVKLVAKDVDAALRSFMDRRFERAKLVGTSSIQLGEWEMRPETAGDPVEMADMIRRRLAKPV